MSTDALRDTLRIPLETCPADFPESNFLISFRETLYEIFTDRKRLHGREARPVRALELKSRPFPFLTAKRSATKIDLAGIDSVSAIRSQLPERANRDLFVEIDGSAFNHRFVADAIEHVGRDCIACFLGEGSGVPLVLVAHSNIAFLMPIGIGREAASEFVARNNRSVQNENGSDEQEEEDRPSAEYFEQEVARLRAQVARLKYCHERRRADAKSLHAQTVALGDKLAEARAEIARLSKVSAPAVSS
jgi:hypothetical protein